MKRETVRLVAEVPDAAADRLSRRLLSRLAAYTLLLAAGLAVLPWTTQLFGAHWVLAENGLVEWAQVAVLALSSAFLAQAARRQQVASYMLMAIALWVIVARELDGLFDLFLYHGSWRIAALAALIATGAYAARNSSALSREYPELVQKRSFGLLFAAFLIVLVVSRILGMKAFWHAALGYHCVGPAGGGRGSRPPGGERDSGPRRPASCRWPGHDGSPGRVA